MEVKKASIKDSIEDRYNVHFNNISYESPKAGLLGFNKYKNQTIDQRPKKVDAATGEQNDILSQNRLLSGPSSDE